MRILRVEQLKIITADNEFDFMSKFNSFMKELAQRGIQAQAETSPANGLVAYIRYIEETVYPETMKEEFEQGGEKHTCVECPYFIMPTDGRRKYTKCPRQQGLAYRERACCEKFYEELSEGKLTLREVWHG